MDMPAAKPAVVVRDLTTIEDLRRIEPLETEVWGLTERDVSPMTLLIAALEAGSIFVGAFDGDAMVGFAFGFPSIEAGHIAIHSHMLAVLPKYRDLNLGYKLKLAQRDRALSMGIREMSWTFDPLQSRNAHFNFAKVGVVSNRYKADFYGNDSSSVLHQNGTDRLWVTWALDSNRVKQRVNGASPKMVDAISIVSRDPQGHPHQADLAGVVTEPYAFIEIPDDIVALEQRDRELAWQWRLATRWAFAELLHAGFFVADFFRGTQGTGKYLLTRGDMREFLGA